MNTGSSDERLNGRSSKYDQARTTGIHEAGLKNAEMSLGLGKISVWLLMLASFFFDYMQYFPGAMDD